LPLLQVDDEVDAPCISVGDDHAALQQDSIHDLVKLQTRNPEKALRYRSFIQMALLPKSTVFKSQNLR
jgi:hypothetical protein